MVIVCICYERIKHIGLARGFFFSLSAEWLLGKALSWACGDKSAFLSPFHCSSLYLVISLSSSLFPYLSTHHSLLLSIAPSFHPFVPLSLSLSLIPDRMCSGSVSVAGRRFKGKAIAPHLSHRWQRQSKAITTQRQRAGERKRETQQEKENKLVPAWCLW